MLFINSDFLRKSFVSHYQVLSIVSLVGAWQAIMDQQYISVIQYDN
jgi:hypothetical protein